MPGGDRTGPRGMGPGTGRGMGICGGYDAPGFTRRGYGRGFGGALGGFGRGGGRFAGGAGLGGFGGDAARTDAYRNAPGPDQEKLFLDREIAGLKDHLAGLEKRRTELDGDE